MGISELPAILQRHSMTPDDLKRKLTNPVFRNMYHEAKSIWNSDLSVQERIRLKAQVLVEDSLIELYTMFQDKEMASGTRIEAFKNMAKVAAVDTADKSDNGAGRVNIVFNIPGVGVTTATGEVYEVKDDREAIPNSA